MPELRYKDSNPSSATYCPWDLPWASVLLRIPHLSSRDKSNTFLIELLKVIPVIHLFLQRSKFSFCCLLCTNWDGPFKQFSFASWHNAEHPHERTLERHWKRKGFPYQFPLISFNSLLLLVVFSVSGSHREWGFWYPISTVCSGQRHSPPNAQHPPDPPPQYFLKHYRSWFWGATHPCEQLPPASRMTPSQQVHQWSTLESPPLPCVSWPHPLHRGLGLNPGMGRTHFLVYFYLGSSVSTWGG